MRAEFPEWKELLQKSTMFPECSAGGDAEDSPWAEKRSSFINEVLEITYSGINQAVGESRGEPNGAAGIQEHIRCA